MNSRETIKSLLGSAHHITKTYVSDLEGGDLLVRAVPGMNHIAWQLGHLVGYEDAMLEGLNPGKSPRLREGFTKAYTKETAKSDDHSVFHSKETLLASYDAVRTAVLSFLEGLDESALDGPGPEFCRGWAPTVGTALISLGTHEIMHAGQFVVVRRKLGKPILI